MPFNEDEFINTVLSEISINDAREYHILNNLITNARESYNDSWPDSSYKTYAREIIHKNIISDILKNNNNNINKNNFISFIDDNPDGRDIIIETIILIFENYWKMPVVYYHEKRYYVSINPDAAINQLERVSTENLTAFYVMITIALAPLNENLCPKLKDIIQAFTLIFTKEAIYRVITIEE